MAVIAQTKVVRTLSLAAVAVAASVAVPFVVHLFPGGQAVGATLLPIFWAPLLAAYFFGPVPALVAALAAPAANHAVTGMPPAFLLPSLTAELAVFVGLVLLALHAPAARRSPLVAPVAYLVARLAVAAGVQLGGAGALDVAVLGAAAAAAVPGLIALFALNGLAVLGAGATRRR